MIVFTILRVAEFIYSLSLSLSLSDNKHEVYPYIIKKKKEKYMTKYQIVLNQGFIVEK